jgi:phosphoribosylformimino-5-aminoimidazole carboxamide ribotide isomerase
MDLLGGLAVQAVRGERATYKPVDSVLAETAEPLALAKALADETLCRSMYVADLDAIQGGQGHLETLAELGRALPVELMVDAGVSRPEDVRIVLAHGAAQAILGTETLPSMEALGEIIKAATPNSILPSLDVRGGKVLSRAPELAGAEPLDALARLVDAGLLKFILLTLDVVGTGGGPDFKLLAAAKKRFPEIEIIAGGGARGMDDVRRAKALGLAGLLTATALHRGWITGKKLREIE